MACIVYGILCIIASKLKKMNAVITGATRGIGKAIATLLAENGYDLAVCARNEAEMESLAAELSYTGVRIFTYRADLSIREQTYDFANAVKSVMPTVDVLVNNAGLYRPGLVLDEADENFEYLLEINLMSPYYLGKFFGKMMREQRSGRIFNICSVASKIIAAEAGGYSVTKSALLSLNNVWRMELAPYNVKVTAILPGSTLTSSWDGTTIPAERFVQPEDVAKTIYTILNLTDGANVDEVTLKPIQF